MQITKNKLWVPALCILLTRCADIPVAKVAISHEALIKREKSAETPLTRDVERWVNLKSTPSVKGAVKGEKDAQVFIRSVAQRLIRPSVELKDRPIGIVFISAIRGTWRSFALPGTRVYLSRPLIRQLDYENEIAAVLALELAHLSRHSFASRVDESTASTPLRTEGDLFGENGVLTFSEKDHAEAIELAVSLLYRAEYDPRGLTSLLSQFRKNPAQNPYGEGTIDKLEEVARRTVALQSPLRNPVVRSAEFVKILPRIKTL